MSGGSLYIALSGLEAQQSALQVVSENVSNANTPGYLAETANLANLQVAGSPIGSGVTVSGIVQSSSTFARQMELQASASNSYASQLQSLLSSAQNFFMEPSSSGISEQMSTMWNSFASVANDPTQMGPRMQLVANATDVANAVNQAATGLTDLFSQTASAVGTQLQTVNQQLSDVAKLNQQISGQSGSNGGANSLIDQRNQLLDKLTSEIGITVSPAAAGQVNVLSGGISLVQGSQAQQLTFTAGSGSPPSTPNTASVSLVSSGAVLPVTSGEVGAELTALNSNLPTYGGYLNQLATTLANQVNQQLAAGQSTTSSGTGSQAGIPLFVGASGAPINASNLEVNSQIAANPMLIAASGSPYAAADGTNAQTIANLQTQPTGPNALWSQIAGSVGVDVANAQTLATSANSVYQQAYGQEQAISGVNVNSQLVNMVNYQNAYQAAAKIIGTISQTLQSLIQSV